MGNAENVLIGVGQVLTAPKGTPLPTDATADPNGAFVDLGYISDAGVVAAIARQSTTFTDWHGDTIRKKATSHDATYKFTMIETDSATLEAYFGTQDDPDTVVKVKAQDGLRQSWIIDMVDGDNLLRDVIPDGEVVEVGDITYASTELVSYTVTLTTYPDANGDKVLKYRDLSDES